LTSSCIEKNKNSSSQKEISNKSEPAPVKKLINLYNEICVNMAKVRSSNANRDKYIRARWKDFPDENVWRRVFEVANKNQWVIEHRPSIIHILRPENWDRYLSQAEKPLQIQKKDFKLGIKNFQAEDFSEYQKILESKEV